MVAHLGMTENSFSLTVKKKYKTSFYYEINNEKDKKHDRIIFFYQIIKNLFIMI